MVEKKINEGHLCSVLPIGDARASERPLQYTAQRTRRFPMATRLPADEQATPKTNGFHRLAFAR